MEYIVFDKKIAYAYTDAFINKKIAEIKNTFREKCLRSDDFSEEYKAYISDINNIKVNFHQIFQHDIQCKMSYVSVDYEFKCEAEKYWGNVTFNSSDMKSCLCHFGNGIIDDPNNSIYKRVDNDGDMSANCRKVFNTSITKEKIANTITLSHLSDQVKNELRRNARKYEKYYNFNLLRITDYGIRTCDLIVFPTFKFDVFVEFEGAEYGFRNIENISDIKAKGKNSNHYDEYECKMKDVRQKYYSWRIPALILYGIGIAAGLFMAIFLWVRFSKANLALYYTHNIHTILIVIAMFAVGILSVVFFCLLNNSDEPYERYNKNKSVDSQIDEQIRLVCSARKKHVILSTVWILVVAVAVSALAVYSNNILKKSETHFYVPGLFGNTYEFNKTVYWHSDDGRSHEETLYQEIKITKCDKLGNVEAELTETHEECGKVTKIKLKGKAKPYSKEEVRIELVFDEYIDCPSQPEYMSNYMYISYRGGLLKKGMKVFQEEPNVSAWQEKKFAPYGQEIVS